LVQAPRILNWVTPDAANQIRRTELARVDLAELDDKAIVDKRHGMELKLVAIADRNLEALTSITEDLRALHWTRDDEGRFIGMA
jgi:hypothetical protein